MHNSVLPDVRKGTVSMGVYIKNWSLADWNEFLKWAKIGANNAMIGEFAEVEEIPPHGDLIERDKLREKEFIHNGDAYAVVMSRDIRNAPTIIPADESDMDSFIRVFEEDDEEDGMDSFIRILKD